MIRKNAWNSSSRYRPTVLESSSQKERIKDSGGENITHTEAIPRWDGMGPVDKEGTDGMSVDEQEGAANYICQALCTMD